MRRWLLVAVLVLAGCSDDDRGGVETEGGSSSTLEETPAEPGVTLEDVKDAAYGTNVCPTDRTCPVVLGVDETDGAVDVASDLFPDGESAPVAQGLCVVTTQLTDKPVHVYGQGERLMSRGQAGRVPICEVL